MIRFIIAVFILTSANLSAQATRSKSSETKFPDAKTYAKKIYSYKIINTLNHTYCYDIYADGKRMIHQPSMPSMPGNEGFKTKTPRFENNRSRVPLKCVAPKHIIVCGPI